MSTFIRMFNLLAVDSMKQTSELQVVTKYACQYGIHNLFLMTHIRFSLAGNPKDADDCHF